MSTPTPTDTFQAPDLTKPFIQVSIRTREINSVGNSVGTTPIGIYLSPSQAEDLYQFNRNFELGAISRSGSQAYRLVGAVVEVYSEVRDSWLNPPPPPPTHPTLENILDILFNTPADRVRLRRRIPPSGHPTVQLQRCFEGGIGPVWEDYDPEFRFPKIGSPTTAAEVVCAWASDPSRTFQELSLAHGYLSRWPEGPQIPAPKE